VRKSAAKREGIMSVPDQYNNASWAEGNLWYGWTYSPEKQRYYFEDIGYESLIELWEQQWKKEAGEE